MMEITVSEYINKYQLEQTFSEETLSQIMMLSLKSGEFLVTSGDKVEQLYMQVGGKLKISTALPNGRTMLLRFSYPLSVLGDIELIDNQPAQVQVECSEDSTFLVIPHRIIHECDMHRPVFLHYLLGQICLKMNTNFNTATMNILSSVEHRFASYLLSMSEDSIQGSYRKDELETSKLTEIAEMLGTSYRHLNRIVKKFTDEQLILKEKKKISIINVDGLKKRSVDHSYIE